MAQSDEQAEEGKRWQRKALKWLKDGKPLADMPFDTDIIPLARRVSIREALADCKTREDVKAVFEPAADRETDAIRELAAEIRAAREALG